MRISGDEAAHPSEMGQIESSEALASLEFMDAFLEHAVALPNRRKVRKAARQANGQTVGERPEDSN